MPQITLYLPEDVAREVKRLAREAHMSVSAYMTELARQAIQPGDWRQQLDALYGSCTLNDVEDLPVQERPDW